MGEWEANKKVFVVPEWSLKMSPIYHLPKIFHEIEYSQIFIEAWLKHHPFNFSEYKTTYSCSCILSPPRRDGVVLSTASAVSMTAQCQPMSNADE